jgi:site-specific DNA recombinase
VSRYLLSGLLKCGVCDANFIMSNAAMYRCSSRTNGGSFCCSNRQGVRRDVVEPIVLLGVKQDLLSDEAIAEVRRIVADAQHGKKSQSATVECDIRDIAASIERVTDAIAEAGSRARCARSSARSSRNATTWRRVCDRRPSTPPPSSCCRV